MLLELRHARELALAGTQTLLHPEVDARVLLCSANLRRWHNGVTAVCFNACILWTYRHQVTLSVVGFCEDNDPLSFLSWSCQAAIENGLVMLGSGGSAACRAIDSGTAQGPWADHLASRGQEVAPGLRYFVLEGLTEDMPKVMRHWHASVGKNTSHVFAEYCAQLLWDWGSLRATTVMVNLDADNLITNAYVREIVSQLASRNFASGTIIQPSGLSAGVTGRLAYLLTDFQQVNGYDMTNTHPMGYQDIDLRDRVRSLPTRVRWSPPGEAAESSSWNTRTKLITMNVATNVGTALPNDTTDAKEDRGSSKVLHTGVVDESQANRRTWA